MNKIITKLGAIKLVGVTAQTSKRLEMSPETSKIPATMQNFIQRCGQAQIIGRKNPGRLFVIYTKYDGDAQYTYFVGEEVNHFDNIPQGFEKITIAAQSYVKFTSHPGSIPEMRIDMWQKIWKMTAADLGGTRTYMADFELYDHRCQNHQNAVFDIYIGIKKNFENSEIWVGETYINPLLKAFNTFERFRLNDKTEQERAGTIQAFGYCFELSWKIMKRLLQERGISVNSPREVFRMAALEGFINDTEVWFDFLKKRNMTVHTYNQNDAEEVLSICESFSLEIKKFLSHIGVAV